MYRYQDVGTAQALRLSACRGLLEAATTIVTVASIAESEAAAEPETSNLRRIDAATRRSASLLAGNNDLECLKGVKRADVSHLITLLTHAQRRLTAAERCGFKDPANGSAFMSSEAVRKTIASCHTIAFTVGLRPSVSVARTPIDLVGMLRQLVDDLLFALSNPERAKHAQGLLDLFWQTVKEDCAMNAAVVSEFRAQFEPNN